MKKHLILLIVFILLFSCIGVAYSYSCSVEEELLTKVSYNENKPIDSKHVRVGIGNNNFSNYEWQSASIYATDEFDIYNNQTYIGTFEESDAISIKMVGKIFVLTNSNNEVIAKVSGPIKFKSSYGNIGIKDLKRAGQKAQYRGQIELVSAPNDGKFYIVNELELEDYLKGVVPNEMPISFGLEALKAQSVAARNYVLSPRVKANPNYDVVDSVASQVYFGANTEKPLSNRAVSETRGIVALYNWDLILAQYSSTAGGYTESYHNAFSDPITKQFPAPPKSYLMSQPDNPEFTSLSTEEAAHKFYKSKPKSYDVKSSYYRWTREWNGQEIQDAIQANIATQSSTGFIYPKVLKGETIGIVKELRAKKRGESGKIMELEIVTDNGTYTVQKELVIRRLLTKDGKSLPSANVVFDHEYDENGDLIYIKATGGGYGHGVGMSQYGAGYMSTHLNKTFDEILKHYYNGITLGTNVVVMQPTSKDTIQTFYSKNGCAKLVIDNRHKFSNINLIINGVEGSLKLDTQNRYSEINLTEYLKKGENSIIYKTPKWSDKTKGVKMFVELVEENGRKYY